MTTTTWTREPDGAYVRGEQTIVRIGRQTWALSEPGAPCEYHDTLRSAKESAEGGAR